MTFWHRPKNRAATLIWRYSIALPTNYKHLTYVDALWSKGPQENLLTADISPPPIAGVESDKTYAKTQQLDRHDNKSPQVKPSAARLATSRHCPPRKSQTNLTSHEVTQSLHEQTSPQQIAGILCWMQSDPLDSPWQQSSDKNTKPLQFQTSPHDQPYPISLDVHSVAKKLTIRPRKYLRWKSPRKLSPTDSFVIPESSSTFSTAHFTLPSIYIKKVPAY